MDVLLGGLAGAITGVIGSLIAATVQTMARWIADRRHSDERVKNDAGWTPYWVLFGILGLIAGLSWTARLGGTWVTGAVAGLGVPALATVIFLVIGVVGIVRR